MKTRSQPHLRSPSVLALTSAKKIKKIKKIKKAARKQRPRLLEKLVLTGKSGGYKLFPSGGSAFVKVFRTWFHGRSISARKPLKKGDAFAYGGDVHNAADAADAAAAADNTFSFDLGQIRVGGKLEECFLNPGDAKHDVKPEFADGVVYYVNEANKANKGANGANAELISVKLAFSDDDGQDVVISVPHLMMTRNVPAGEQILVPYGDYGKGYDRSHYGSWHSSIRSVLCCLLEKFI